MNQTPTVPDTHQDAAQASNRHARASAKRRTLLRGIVGSGTLIVMLAAGTALGASRGCVTAPRHGASVVFSDGTAHAVIPVTFSGTTLATSTAVYIVQGKIGAPGQFAVPGQALLNTQPIVPDANHAFSQTINVARDGNATNGILWNDDDAIGFEIFECPNTSSACTAMSTVVQQKVGLTTTNHNIAAVSDRPDQANFPSQTAIGLISTRPVIRFAAECDSTSPPTDGRFFCPIPGDVFPNQDNGNFLSKKQPQGQSVTDTTPADRYYARFPAANQYSTLGAFITGNGFNSDVTACKSTVAGANPSGETCAWYRNENDLGFGRQMHCRGSYGATGLLTTYACYVTNFPNENDAWNNLQPAQPNAAVAATVAMTWQATTVLSDRVRFYVYSQTGTRLDYAALDGGGNKDAPTLCLNCHGGAYDTATDTVTGTHFLPFDKAYLPQTTLRAAQDATFKALNTAVYAIERSDSGNTVTPITELVAGWYNNFSSGSTYGGAFVPTGWSGNPALYLGVVAPYCRTCHVAQQPAYTFTSLTEFPINDVLTQVCGNNRTMPHAERTYQRFWESGAPAILATELGPYSAVTHGAYEACKFKPLPANHLN